MANGDCPLDHKMSSKNLSSPEAFQQWFSKASDQLKIVSDFICCLPDEYLSSYVINFAGKAGQNGSAESPRIVLHNQRKTDATIVTFNGGEAYLNQPLNVEMGFIRDSKKFEVYDVEFYHRTAQLSEKNPPRCMRCHSDTNISEARPFFHMALASSYVGGAPVCSNEEDEIQSKSQQLALESIVKNSRFRCLDKAAAQNALAHPSDKHPKFTGVFPERLKKLRETLRTYQQKRFVRLLQETPNYDVYKFAIVGAQICPNFKMNEWLPADALAQHTNATFLRPEIAEKDPKDFSEVRNHLRQEFEVRRRTLAKILKSDFDLQRGTFRPAFQSWLCPNEPSFQKTEGLAPSLEGLFGKYELDSRLRVFPASETTVTTNLRLLTEARGVDTLQWTLAFNPKEEFQPFENVAEELVIAEPQKSDLRALFSAGKGFKVTAAECDSLKAASIKAFQPRKPNSHEKRLKP